ncbi:MAG: GNAT family N-acetyltransferase [Cyclobacteriaceae bacterium]
MPDNFIFKPLTSETWQPFESLFGPKGACGGCWCMTWRLTKSEYDSSKGDGNRKKMKKLASKGDVIGVLAFHDNIPIGWCAVAPREKYVRLENSRSLKPVDDKTVWCISCFFIAKPYRRKGLSVKLLKAAVDYAGSHGAKIVEGYPIEPKDKEMPDVFAWTGILSSYLRAGFTEEKRHSPARPIVRFYR